TVAPVPFVIPVGPAAEPTGCIIVDPGGVACLRLRRHVRRSWRGKHRVEPNAHAHEDVSMAPGAIGASLNDADEVVGEMLDRGGGAVGGTLGFHWSPTRGTRAIARWAYLRPVAIDPRGRIGAEMNDRSGNPMPVVITKFMR